METTKYSERFLKAVKKVLKHEGGYVNDPDDAGGETNFGISKRAFPELNISDITEDDAIQIYHQEYWERIQGELINSDALALQIFDMAVNAGTGAAAKLVQRILNVAQDGDIGPMTMQALNSYPSVSVLVERYKFERVKFYCTIVSKNYSQAKFLKGWVRRIES